MTVKLPENKGTIILFSGSILKLNYDCCNLNSLISRNRGTTSNASPTIP
jgi:hypothetical protein